jgi:peptidyl-prolyl cis-trans isomerase A (cyclophilin A)
VSLIANLGSRLKNIALKRLIFIPALLALAAIAAPTQTQTSNTEVLVVLETDLGQIELALDATHAPLTTANFLHYVDRGFYDGGLFHRTVKLDNQPDNKIKIEVIQAGINPKFAKEDGPPIPLERTNKTGLKHLDGVISMARDGPATATSDFFICIGDQPSLDFRGMRNPDGQGFAAFGRVVEGMDVVRKIQNSPSKEQSLAPPVKIRKAYRKNA